MVNKTVVLDGDCQLIIPQDGELGVVTAIRKPYPIYTGETTVTPSGSVQVLDTELTTLTKDITVNAIPGDYVGSDIPRRDNTDVTASGATVTAPAGYYEEAASKAVQSGTEGTPSATKGTVSNHSVSVTPSVTNTAGYISGGTKTGTAVTVSASELVSGAKEITENGTGIDVANYASVDVAVPATDPNLQSKTNINPTTSSQTIEADPGYDGLSSVQINAMPTGSEGTPTATKGAVSNHSVTVTPTVTNSAGYISGGTKTGTAVTVTAAELDSGTKNITANGSGQDVVGYATVDVNVPNSYTASDEGKVVNNGALTAQTSATYTDNGTYDTTLKNSVTVNVQGGAEPVIEPLSVTENGTYSAPSGVDGYSPVTVSVSGGGGISIDDIAERTYPGVLSGNASYISKYAFYSNNVVTKASFPSAKKIHVGAFWGCINLSEAYFSTCEYIDFSAFQNCSMLNTICAPQASAVMNSAFNSCTTLETVDLPECQTVGPYAFDKCQSLSVARIPKAKEIYSVAFRSCYFLISLYLDSVSSVPTLSTNVFSSTPIGGYSTRAGQFGSIYVPSSLYSAFQTATNWSSVASRMVSV